MPDKYKWQAFSNTLSNATWGLAKVFHFIGRVAGRVSEELGYEDDFPFGTDPMDRKPREVTKVHIEHYEKIPLDPPTEVGDNEEDEEQDATMKYWFDA